MTEIRFSSTFPKTRCSHPQPGSAVALSLIVAPTGKKEAFFSGGFLCFFLFRKRKKRSAVQRKVRTRAMQVPFTFPQ